MSIIKVNFIFECIKKVNNGKATILDPGRCQDKKDNFDLKMKKREERIVGNRALMGHSEEIMQAIFES